MCGVEGDKREFLGWSGSLFGFLATSFGETSRQKQGKSKRGRDYVIIGQPSDGREKMGGERSVIKRFNNVFSGEINFFDRFFDDANDGLAPEGN